MRPAGYYKVYELVKAARMAEPMDTKELERIRDYYGYDLYIEALKEVVEKIRLS